MLGLKTVEIRRYQVSWDAYGQPVIGAAVSTQQIQASVQPLTWRQRQALEEGSRLSARFVMYVRGNPDIRPGGRDENQPADFAVWKGEEYEIEADQDWTEHTRGLPHRSYILLEVAHGEQP